MKNTVTVSNEKFQDIYTDKKFRNEVAYAHQFCDKLGNVLGLQTTSYPTTYIVTEEQKNTALSLIQTDITMSLANIEKHPETLVFVGMGTQYNARYNDDVCNHRIRTEFMAADGHRYFIEFGTGTGHGIRIDHAIDRDKEDLHNENLLLAREERKKHRYMSDEYIKASELCEKWSAQTYYNFKGLERQKFNLQYTNENIVNIVNEYFGCNFKNMYVDNYTLTTDDFICKSPKLAESKEAA